MSRVQRLGGILCVVLCWFFLGWAVWPYMAVTHISWQIGPRPFLLTLFLYGMFVWLHATGDDHFGHPAVFWLSLPGLFVSGVMIVRSSQELWHRTVDLLNALK